jgi:hypothetical protein
MRSVDPQYEYDQLTPIVETFLGYRPTAAEMEGFPYEIYKFIIRSLRDRDQNEKVGGTRLLERFLMGPQEVWFDLHQVGSKIYNMFDPEEIEAVYLPSLAQLVAFGREQTDIIGVATEDELRRIIAGAIEFWKTRWQDNGLKAAVQLATGNRFKIRDYFDFRFIVGETHIAEDLEDTDSYMISVKTRKFFRIADDGISRFGSDPNSFSSPSTLPKEEDIGGYIVIFDDTGSPSLNRFYLIENVDIPNEQWFTVAGDYFLRAATDLDFFIAFPYDEFLTEIRVVDEETGEGELNRTLLEKLVDLQRPSSERVNIVYVDFLDLFQTQYDLGMWEDSTYGDYIAAVDNGVLTLTGDDPDETGLKTNRTTTATWKNHAWKTKVALKTNGSVWLGFYDDGFRVEIGYSGFGTGYVRLWRDIASVWTAVTAQISHPSLNLDTFWTYTIETYNLPSGDVNIKLRIDGNLIIDYDSVTTVTEGNIFLLCDQDVQMEVAETELWIYPLDISRVGPNP